MSVLICKMCGGNLEFIESETICECDHCGRRQTIPQINDEKKLSLFNRANQLRADCDFDKAANVYETIISEFPSEAEAYWGLVLCKFGIEYVDDPLTHSKIPTCHRSSFNSVYDDDDYKATIENASTSAKLLYEAEAAQIEELRLGILDISEREEPYDVFICFKEHDSYGDRTPESIMAQEIYEQLTDKGYKVFFSRITLEDILGKEYEPYIFAALNSSKVMLAFGTSAENYNSVWVKNEWSRFLQLIASGQKKTLIPCYADMEIDDMPPGFSKRQAQNMAKLGWQQDLIRGVEKIIPKAQAPKEKIIIKESSANPSVDSLLKRVFIFLEDSDWVSADEYAEKVLDIDPENAEAYLGKLMAELHAKNKASLRSHPRTFEKNANYLKVLRYASESLKKEMIDCNEAIEKRNKYNTDKAVYDEALSIIKKSGTSEDYKAAAEKLGSIAHFEDAARLAEDFKEKSILIYKEETYERAMQRFNSDDPEKIRYSATLFELIEDYKDAAILAGECEFKAKETEKAHIYKRSLSAYKSSDKNTLLSAKKAFESIAEYKDSAEMAVKCDEKLKETICFNAEAKFSVLTSVNLINEIIAELESISGFEKADKLREKFIAKKEKIIRDTQQKQKEQQEKERKQKKKEKTKKAARTSFKVICILCVVAAVAVAGILIYLNAYAKPKEKYDTALNHYNAGEYEQAISMLTELDGFSDSEDKLLEVKYAFAGEKLENDDVDGAYLLYCELSGYNEETGKYSSKPYLDSIEKRAELVLTNPRFANIGDIITFGTYEQDNDAENGSEDVEWLVVDKKDSQVYLISMHSLDFKPWSENSSGYHKNWTESSLRDWLNDSFYNTAFTDEEKSLIVTETITTSRSDGTDVPDSTSDPVFLMDIDEFSDEEKYGFIFDGHTITEYAASLSDSSSGSFWLRTPSTGGGAYMKYDARDNNFDNGITSRWGYEGGFVRPCIYLNFD